MTYPSHRQFHPAYGPPPRNGPGTTALILGILGALFALVPLIGVIAWPLVILGLVFGIVGIVRWRRGTATNSGMAVTGTVLSAFRTPGLLDLGRGTR
ncbi:hypothetical protein AFB00_03770 [Pseudonocardia sp. HH130630-07]|nr:hypothetical protein AFB00_03770 [Pseudonocardia sp. HH130630-07]